MGKIYADIEIISNDDLTLERKGYIKKNQIRRMTVNMLVDSGAYNLAINENIKTQLGLEKLDEQMFELADGTLQKFEVVGPVEVRFKNRQTTTRAVVLPGNIEPLLGQIPMEDMDVVLFPREERMDINPNTPFMPKKALK
jgi:clan AA aspartic protease